MNRQSKSPAMLPGAFETIANGHPDVIQRGRRLFDGLPGGGRGVFCAARQTMSGLQHGG